MEMANPLRNKIGVIVDSFGVGVREGLLKAKEVGAEGVQIYAVSGEMDPATLDAAARRELRDRIGGLGLEISALAAISADTASRTRRRTRPRSRNRSGFSIWRWSSARPS